MLAGSVAEPLPLVRVTETPFGPAGEASVIVPMDGDPPATGLGDRVRPLMVPCPGP
jgi:hypothetical protein